MSDPKNTAAAREIAEAMKRFEVGAVDDAAGTDQEEIREEIVREILDRHYPAPAR